MGALKGLLSEVFKLQHVPMVQVSFGEHEQMAHVCQSFVRVQDDAGLLRSTLTDLLQLGQEGSAQFVTSCEASRPRGPPFGKQPVSLRKRPAAASQEATLKKRPAASVATGKR